LSSGDSTTVVPAQADAGGEVEEAEQRDDQREALLARFRDELGDAVVDAHIRAGDALWIRVNRDAWRYTAEVAKQKLDMSFFDFLSAIDWLPSPFGRDMDSQEDATVHGQEPKEAPPMTTGYAGGDTRFQLLARVYDTRTFQGVVFKADLPDDDLHAETWSGVYRGADWHERETWEMFGIEFTGRSKLTHIYLPTEFEGHPLRKDFPLLARRVKPWPGIVDVEPMPGGGDDGEEDAEAEGASE
jgi:NADH-quinone oxidoreductase subunit C